MKVTGCIRDFHLLYGNSYRVFTDGNFDYQVAPQSEKSVFIGWIEWTKELHNGIIQTRYKKGLLVPFSDKNPVTGEFVDSVDEVTHSLIVLMLKSPDEFETLFLKKAKQAKGKKGKYPKISKKDIKEILSRKNNKTK